MTRSLAAWAVLVSFVFAYGQTGDNSPSSTVQAFWTYETNGGRLTDDGWRQADRFFDNPPAPSRQKKIVVIANQSSVSNNALVRGDERVVIVEVMELGQIDGKLRWTPPESATMKTELLFQVVRRGDSPQWKIHKRDPSPQKSVVWLSLDTALRYVTEVNQSEPDAQVRRNAAKTLAILRKFAMRDAHHRNKRNP